MFRVGVRLVAEPPHLGVERGHFAEDVQPCLVIAASLNLDIPSRLVNPMSDLYDYRLCLPNSVLAPEPLGNLLGDSSMNRRYGPLQTASSSASSTIWSSSIQLLATIKQW